MGSADPRERDQGHAAIGRVKDLADVDWLEGKE